MELHPIFPPFFQRGIQGFRSKLRDLDPSNGRRWMIHAGGAMGIPWCLPWCLPSSPEPGEEARNSTLRMDLPTDSQGVNLHVRRPKRGRKHRSSWWVPWWAYLASDRWRSKDLKRYLWNHIDLWVYYSITTSLFDRALEIMVRIREIIPNMAELFRLVNYCNLPRSMDMVVSYIVFVEALEQHPWRKAMPKTGAPQWSVSTSCDASKTTRFTGIL